MRVEIEQKEQISRSFDSVCVRVSYMGKDVYNSNACIEGFYNNEVSEAVSGRNESLSTNPVQMEMVLLN